jgi:glycerophosphoryl diester phosphodiesterase
MVFALSTPASAQPFELHGHRGARGLAPENTLAGFRKALETGVTHLETDLAVTKDGVVVISHDPTLNPDLVRTADGKWLPARGPAINTLTMDELRHFDIGRTNPQSHYGQLYPEQQAADGERFPTLAEFLQFARQAGRPDLRFNIELKLTPDAPHQTPDPETFARLVLAEIARAGVGPRVLLQSFDWRAVRAVRRQAPQIETACLTIESQNFDNVQRGRPGPSPWLGGIDVDDLGGSVPRAVKEAGCAVWSTFWRNLMPETLKEARTLGLRVVPWTVNDPAQMTVLIDMGVQGLITDYPDRARKVMQQKGLALP